MWLRRSRAGKVRSRLPVCRWIDAGFCASAHTQDVRSGSRLCENSDVGLACRKFVSTTSNNKRTVLAVAVERRKERKQFCAFSARARFHTAWTHLGLSRLSNNLHEAGSDHGGIGSSVSFSLEPRARCALKEERFAFLTQNPPPLVFQNAEHLFYLSSEATPPGLSRENSRPLASGARTALRVRRPNREPVRRQFPPGPMPALRRQCFA